MTLLAFFMANVLGNPVLIWALPVPAPEGLTESPPIPFALTKLQEIVIPNELGFLDEQYQGSTHKTVIYLQDAHAIGEAQHSIKDLIAYFLKHFEIPVVALEGAEGRLDPTLFKTFPDPEILNAVFNDYLTKGEIGGGAAASVLVAEPAVYVGIENWQIYLKGVQAFLEALNAQEKALASLEVFRRYLDAAKEQSYSELAAAWDRHTHNWHRRHEDMKDLLQFLSRFLPPDPRDFPSLYTVLTLLKQEGTSEEKKFVLELRRISTELKERFEKEEHAFTSAERRAFYRAEQAWQTEAMSNGQFAKFLLDLRAGAKISQKLRRLIETERKIERLQGPALYRELNTYLEETAKEVLHTDEERQLHEISKKLSLFERLLRFELVFEDWQLLHEFRVKDPVRQFGRDLRNLARSLSRVLPTVEIDHTSFQRLSQGLTLALQFYETAVERDEIFAKKINALLAEHDTLLIVTGGFHVPQLCKNFRKAGVSYALISPAMTEDPENSAYFDYMRGNVSWRHYFEPRHGSINLYEAFSRATVRRLLTHPAGKRAEPVPLRLKHWRDRIIRRLAREGRLDETGRYTSILDRFISDPTDDAWLSEIRASWTERIEEFIAGVRELKKEGRLNEASLSQLFAQPANQFPVAVASLVRSLTLPQGLVVQDSRVRSLAVPSALTETSNVKDMTPARRAEVRRADAASGEEGVFTEQEAETLNRLVHTMATEEMETVSKLSRPPFPHSLPHWIKGFFYRVKGQGQSQPSILRKAQEYYFHNSNYAIVLGPWRWHPPFLVARLVKWLQDVANQFFPRWRLNLFRRGEEGYASLLGVTGLWGAIKTTASRRYVRWLAEDPWLKFLGVQPVLIHGDDWRSDRIPLEKAPKEVQDKYRAIKDQYQEVKEIFSQIKELDDRLSREKDQRKRKSFEKQIARLKQEATGKENRMQESYEAFAKWLHQHGIRVYDLTEGQPGMTLEEIFDFDGLAHFLLALKRKHSDSKDPRARFRPIADSKTRLHHRIALGKDGSVRYLFGYQYPLWAEIVEKQGKAIFVFHHEGQPEAVPESEISRNTEFFESGVVLDPAIKYDDQGRKIYRIRFGQNVAFEEKSYMDLALSPDRKELTVIYEGAELEPVTITHDSIPPLVLIRHDFSHEKLYVVESLLLNLLADTYPQLTYPEVFDDLVSLSGNFWVRLYRVIHRAEAEEPGRVVAKTSLGTVANARMLRHLLFEDPRIGQHENRSRMQLTSHDSIAALFRLWAYGLLEERRVKKTILHDFEMSPTDIRAELDSQLTNIVQQEIKESVQQNGFLKHIVSSPEGVVAYAVGDHLQIKFNKESDKKDGGYNVYELKASRFFVEEVQPYAGGEFLPSTILDLSSLAPLAIETPEGVQERVRLGRVLVQVKSLSLHDYLELVARELERAEIAHDRARIEEFTSLAEQMIRRAVEQDLELGRLGLVNRYPERNFAQKLIFPLHGQPVPLHASLSSLKKGKGAWRDYHPRRYLWVLEPEKHTLSEDYRLPEKFHALYHRIVEETLPTVNEFRQDIFRRGGSRRPVSQVIDWRIVRHTYVSLAQRVIEKKFERLFRQFEKLSQSRKWSQKSEPWKDLLAWTYIVKETIPYRQTQVYEALEELYQDLLSLVRRTPPPAFKKNIYTKIVNHLQKDYPDLQDDSRLDHWVFGYYEEKVKGIFEGKRSETRSEEEHENRELGRESSYGTSPNGKRSEARISAEAFNVMRSKIRFTRKKAEVKPNGEVSAEVILEEGVAVDDLAFYVHWGHVADPARKWHSVRVEPKEINAGHYLLKTQLKPGEPGVYGITFYVEPADATGGAWENVPPIWQGEFGQDAHFIVDAGPERRSLRFLGRPKIENFGDTARLEAKFQIYPPVFNETEFYLHWGPFGTETGNWKDEQIRPEEIIDHGDGTYTIRQLVRPAHVGDYGATFYGQAKGSEEKIWAGTPIIDDVIFHISLSDNEKSELKQRLLESLDSYIQTVYDWVHNEKRRGIGKFIFDITKDDETARETLSSYFETLLGRLSQNLTEEERKQVEAAYFSLLTLGIGEIVFVAPEGPHAMAGGMAKVVIELAELLGRSGMNVTVVTPIYEKDQGKKHKSAESLLQEGVTLNQQKVLPVEAGEIEIPFGPVVASGTNQVVEPAHTEAVKVYKAEHGRIRYFFLRHPILAEALYSPTTTEGRLRRAIFLSRGALEIIANEDFGLNPHILLTHDWMAGLIPFFLKTDNRYLNNPRLRELLTVHMIHNYGRDYQGREYINESGRDLWPLLGVEDRHFFWLADPNDMRFFNLTASVIRHVNDGLLTVSQRYAQQILTPEDGEGLHELLQQRANILFGISNGIDLLHARKLYWHYGEEARRSLNPTKLEPLMQEFDENKFITHLPAYKKAALQVVQRKYGLEEDPNAVLISMVGRLAEQKGIELFYEEDAKGVTVLERMLRDNPKVQILIGGPRNDQTADQLQRLMLELMKRDEYAGRIRIANQEKNKFDFISPDEVREIMLGSLFFFMPSRFEPGGITQLEALAGGTLVIGRNIGGIAATIIDHNENPEKANGFLFTKYTGSAFLEATSRAVRTVEDATIRQRLETNAALARNDWSDRLPQYLALFRQISGALSDEFFYPHLKQSRSYLEGILVHESSSQRAEVRDALSVDLFENEKEEKLLSRIVADLLNGKQPSKGVLRALRSLLVRREVAEMEEALKKTLENRLPRLLRDLVFNDVYEAYVRSWHFKKEHPDYDNRKAEAFKAVLEKTRAYAHSYLQESSPGDKVSALDYAFVFPLLEDADSRTQTWFLQYVRMIKALHAEYPSHVQGNIRLLVTQQFARDPAKREFFREIGRSGVAKVIVMDLPGASQQLKSYLEEHPNALLYGFNELPVTLSLPARYRSRIVEAEVDLEAVLPVALTVTQWMAHTSLPATELIKKVPEILPQIVRYNGVSLTISDLALQFLYQYKLQELFDKMA